MRLAASSGFSRSFVCETAGSKKAPRQRPRMANVQIPNRFIAAILPGRMEMEWLRVPFALREMTNIHRFYGHGGVALKRISRFYLKRRGRRDRGGNNVSEERASRV